MNNKRYFVVADIHSFYTELIEGLNKAGYNKENPNHILVVCGDIFDRGPDSIKVYEFLSQLPEENCILIRGNHEGLYRDLLKKNYPQSHDFTNGTVKTFTQIAGYPAEYISLWELDATDTFHWNEVKNKVVKSPITDWLKSDRWVDYVEIGDNIFVHSFIPTSPAIIKDGITISERYNRNWRKASKAAWKNATWGCPYEQFKAGYFDPEYALGKNLVCGHWRTSDFHAIFNTQGTQTFDDIFYIRGLIGLDACTVLSHQVNVLVIDENGEFFDQYGNKLTTINYK